MDLKKRMVSASYRRHVLSFKSLIPQSVMDGVVERMTAVRRFSLKHYGDECGVISIEEGDEVLVWMMKDVQMHDSVAGVFKGFSQGVRWWIPVSRMPKSRFLRSFHGFDEKEIAEFNGSHPVGHGLEALRYFCSMIDDWKLIMFSGEAMVRELKRRHRRKLASIVLDKRGVLTVVTKEIKAPVRKRRIYIGNFIIKAHVVHGIVSWSLFSSRPVKFWLMNPYIKSRRGSQRKVNGNGICFGSHGRIIDRARMCGDVFTVVDACLTLLDQPDAESSGGYRHWDDFLQMELGIGRW